MSDQQQGPDWWLASDGRWYPPDQAPAVPPPETWSTPPPVPPPSSGMSSGGKVALAIAVAVGVVVLLVGAVFLLGDADDTADGDGTTTTARTDPDDDDADGSTPATPEVPDGFAVLEGDGVTIAGPEAWEVLGSDELSMSADEFKAAFPDAPPGMVEQGLQLFEQGALLVAFDFGRDSFADNVTIISVPGEAPLDVIESQAVGQLDSLGGEVVDSGVVDVAVGEALRIEYTLPVALPDGSSQPASGVQHYVPLDGRTYIITVSTGEDAAALADQMVDTFRVA